MAKEWYLMNTPPIYNGGFEGEEWFNYARDGFQEMLQTTMLRDNVEFINSDFSVIVPGKAIIQSVTPDSKLKAEDRQILVPIGTLQKYSYVKFEDDIWIIASEPSNNKFYEKAVLKICHNQLRWQDTETKKIYEYWYWCEDITKYSSGVYQGNIIVKYDKQYSVMLPMDINTRKLHDGMRFILEFSADTPLVFKLTKYDGITGNNKNVKILNLSLTQTVYDPDKDNIDLLIADYLEDKNISTKYKCKINYESDEITLSSFGKYTAVFEDDNSNILNNIAFNWRISSDTFDTNNLVCTYQDNTIKIVVNNDRSLIGKQFDLSIISPTDLILATITITITALW